MEWNEIEMDFMYSSISIVLFNVHTNVVIYYRRRLRSRRTRHPIPHLLHPVLARISARHTQRTSFHRALQHELRRTRQILRRTHPRAS